MNTIRIITTEGCKGCEIARNLIQDAVEESKNDNVCIQIIDCKNEAFKKFIKDNYVTDFPTIFFMKDSDIKYCHTGTMPVPKILHEIKLWFN